MDAVRDRFGDHVSAARSQPYYADVTNPRANKGGVVSYLSETYQIPTEDIATIGDQSNDVLMFAHSGLSIAMGNASHEVQEAARRVTTSNSNEGFANAVERFILSWLGCRTDPGGPVRVLVVGGGPAGVSAALQARELGEDVTLLEAEQVGGTNWNHGPALVRTLARAARLVREWSSWAGFGLEGPPPVPNLEAVLANSVRVARYVHDKKDLAGHLRRNGVDLVDQLGPVRFTGPHTVRDEDGRSWHGDRIIVTVGCRAAALPVPGGDLALTYNDIRTLKALPREVAIIGGADTGCQMASIFADFGVSVRLFEAGPALVPSADASISAALRAAFENKGMQVFTDTRVQNIEGHGEQFTVRFSHGDTTERSDVGVVFAAVGWPANLDHLDLDAAGVTSNRQAIPVDDYLRTNVEHIFAAGDVNGRSKLVQTARIEGRLAAWNAVRGPSRQPAYMRCQAAASLTRSTARSA